MSHRTTHSIVLPTALALIAGLAAGPADGQTTKTDHYKVAHNFKLHTNGNLPPDVYMNYRQRAFAKTNTCEDPQVTPPTSIPIGAGLTTRVLDATAPNSTAEAISEANITTLIAGKVEGSIEARGEVVADVDGCPSPPPRRSFGRADAWSSCSVSARGKYLDSKGNIRWSGVWKNTGSVSGGTGARIAKDPVVLKVRDNTTGVSNTYTLIEIRSTVRGGQARWESGVLANSADDGVLDIQVGVPGITVQQGHLRVVSVDGTVTESEATGIFAGSPVPPIGGLAAFSMALPEIELDYDAGADPTHDIDAEILFDGAGEADAQAASMWDDGGNPILTDLGSGYDGANISTPLNGDNALGYASVIGMYHIAEDFMVMPGLPQELSSLTFPVYQTGAPIGTELLGVYIRIWAGLPGSPSSLVAGDLTTNRLAHMNFFDLYRVPDWAPQDAARAVHDVDVDLTWVPPLPPGHYWVEIAARAQVPYNLAWMPPAVWHTPQDNAMYLNVQTGQWQPIHDPASGRSVTLPILVFGPSNQQPLPCYANCDESQSQPVLNVNDFLCFMNRFAAGDPWANCDGSSAAPVLNINDFLCFNNRFQQGCQQ